MRPVFGGVRRFVFHSGPTNSGKTYAALEELSAAKSGFYAAPLRLLAQEVWGSLKQRGIRASLITGQLKIVDEEATHVCCTVEMTPVSQAVELGVVDEVQMIKDPYRGFAWTRVLTESAADKLIVCGNESASRFLQRVIAGNGRELEERSFVRLNKLRVEKDCAERPLAGDCLVAFSRKELYRLKEEVERTSPEFRPVKIVYGGLPPEERKRQVEEFNKGSSVLVASDAIGLGLNLKIRRIVFTTCEKFDGTATRRLTPDEVKQIAGRAGRHGMGEEEGLVTALEPSDLKYIEHCLSIPNEHVEQAGWLPSLNQLLIANGGDVPENTPIATLLRAFAEQTEPHRDYFLCDMEEIIRAALVADTEGPSLSMAARYSYAIAPVDMDDSLAVSYLALFCRGHAESQVAKLSIKVYSSDSVEPVQNDEERFAVSSRIQRLESLYSVIDLYIWLALRFGDKIYQDLQLAMSTRQQCADEIGKLISRLGYRPPSAKKRRRESRRR